MKHAKNTIEESIVRIYCKALRIPSVAMNYQPWALQAIKEGHSHEQYLEALLSHEVSEQEKHTVQRRLREAKLPRIKTLDEFEFVKNPKVSPMLMRKLAEGEYIKNAEPVLFIGDCGTGKTHLLTGLCVAACKERKRVRFTTAAALVNELNEAHKENILSRTLAKWGRYELLAIDEVGYVPFAENSAELLFQVLAERSERRAIILTTNLPFSEWTTVFPNPRLCKALLDRLTDRAHIVETGQTSYRFQRTMMLRKGRKGGKTEK